VLPCTREKFLLNFENNNNAKGDSDMQEEEILKRDIDILLNSIQQDWEKLQKPSLPAADQKRIR